MSSIFKNGWKKQKGEFYKKPDSEQTNFVLLLQLKLK